MLTKLMDGQDAVKLGAQIIKEGGVVAFPTETVYGLGANALDSTAVNKIFIAKGRPADNPLIVHIADIKEIEKITEEISPEGYKLARAFMPGPITLIFKKKSLIPDIVTAGLSTVAIRMPSHPVARDLILAAGLPIAAPSANISTHVSPTCASHVMDDMEGRIPLIIDGGESEVGIESTVIDVSSDNVRILRPGAVTKDMVEKVIGKTVGTKYAAEVAPEAPGMKYRHYAPGVPVEILPPEDIKIKYDELLKQKIRPVILTLKVEFYGARNLMSLGENTKDAARALFKALREGEKNYDYILSEDFSDGGGIGSSLMNRLNKAAKK
jgi:L-threonylcarbamoyladenylate synthase